MKMDNKTTTRTTINILSSARDTKHYKSALNYVFVSRDEKEDKNILFLDRTYRYCLSYFVEFIDIYQRLNQITFDESLIDWDYLLSNMCSDAMEQILYDGDYILNEAFSTALANLTYNDISTDYTVKGIPLFYYYLIAESNIGKPIYNGVVLARDLWDSFPMFDSIKEDGVYTFTVESGVVTALNHVANSGVPNHWQADFDTYDRHVESGYVGI